MNLKPLNSKVFIKQNKPEEKTASGIIIPQQSQKKTDSGIVLAFGPEVTDLKENDVIIFDIYSGTPVKMEGEEYLLVDHKNILAIISE